VIETERRARGHAQPGAQRIVQLTKVRQLIRDEQMLLLVGAGLSARVGYPTYDAYAAQLLTDFGVTVSEEIREDASAVAETVKSYLARNGRLPEFHAHLERSFGLPGRSRDYDPVHRLLVRSGFRAVVTTNYDSILEDAVSADGKRCEEFDLCARSSPSWIFSGRRAPAGTAPRCCTFTATSGTRGGWLSRHAITTGAMGRTTRSVRTEPERRGGAILPIRESYGRSL
jgi:hypothetical protein